MTCFTSHVIFQNTAVNHVYPDFFSVEHCCWFRCLSNPLVLCRVIAFNTKHTGTITDPPSTYSFPFRHSILPYARGTFKLPISCYSFVEVLYISHVFNRDLESCSPPGTKTFPSKPTPKSSTSFLLHICDLLPFVHYRVKSVRFYDGFIFQAPATNMQMIAGHNNTRL